MIASTRNSDPQGSEHGGAALARPGGPPSDADRAAFLIQASRATAGVFHTDRAMDLALEWLVPDVVDWAQLALVDGPSLHCRALLAGEAVESVDLPLRRADDTVLTRVLSRGVSELMLVPPSEDHAEQALASAVPAEALRRTVTDIRPVDLLVVPLTARGKTFGTLTLARRAGTGFDESLVLFVEDFAQRMALSLDATRALAESRRVARVLGSGLVPPRLPDLPGVRFSTFYRVAFEQDALGGDFYDVHGSPEDWTAVIGDVCGKGAEAAVLTGRVRQAVRTAALVDRDPGAVLGLVNQVLVEEAAQAPEDARDVFVTVLCTRVRRRPEGLRVDLAAAGHPEPYLLRADGVVERVAVAGTVVGLLDRQGYDVVSVDLGREDALLLYTDGVLEAPGREDRFGEQRTEDVLTPLAGADVAAVVEGLAMAVTTHLGDRPHDDIALLALQSTGDAS